MSDRQADSHDLAAAFDAARSGDTDALRTALDAGLAVDAGNESGDTLLMLAAYHCRAPAVELLIERGADADRANAKGQRPLAGVCWKGAVDVARALLDHGAQVNAGGGGMTPLMLAAMCGHKEVVALLLERGADPAVRTAKGHSARDLAANIHAKPVLALLDEALGAGAAD